MAGRLASSERDSDPCRGLRWIVPRWSIPSTTRELRAASIGLCAPTSNPGGGANLKPKSLFRTPTRDRGVSWLVWTTGMGWAGRTRVGVATLVARSLGRLGTRAGCHPFSVQGAVVQGLGPGSALDVVRTCVRIVPLASPRSHDRLRLETCSKCHEVLAVLPSLPVEGGVVWGPINTSTTEIGFVALH